jgi:hypothetical protein
MDLEYKRKEEEDKSKYIEKVIKEISAEEISQEKKNSEEENVGFK